MSNEALKAERNQLEAQLRQIQAENRRLQGEIDRAQGSMHSADRALHDAIDETHRRLGGANGTLGSAHQRVIDAAAVQAKMDELYGQLKQMELANKRIRECNNKKYYDFAVYRTVRKIVQGVMDNLDFSFVSDEVIEKSISRNHLQNPDFWLTCVLLAVMAWRADQRERAERALGRALTLDERKTAAFLMIFYMRLHRESAALKWFTVLTRQPLRGSERNLVLLFFSMLTHTLEEEVSDDARRTVTAYVNGIIDAGMQGSGQTRADAIARICTQFIGLVDDRNFDYPALTQYVTTHRTLAEALASARGTGNVIEFLTDTLTVEETQRNEFLKHYIDEVVAEPCAAERGVYETIAYNEAIIRHQGKVDEAKREFQEMQRVQGDDLDIVSSMIDWVFLPSGRTETNPQMRRSMLVLSKPLIREAGDAYIRRYRSMMTPRQHIAIDGFEADIDLQAPDAIQQQAAAWHRARAGEAKGAIKDIWAIVLMVLGVAGGVALGVLVHPLAALAGAAVALGGLGWLLYNMGQRKRIDEQCARRIAATNEHIGQLDEDWRRYVLDFHEADLLSQQLETRIEAM